MFLIECGDGDYRGFQKNCNFFYWYLIKKLENFGGNLLSEDDHLHWAPPYWNITKETRVLGMFIMK